MENSRECYNCKSEFPEELGKFFCDEKCHEEWLAKNPSYAKGARKYEFKK